LPIDLFIAVSSPLCLLVSDTKAQISAYIIINLLQELLVNLVLPCTYNTLQEPMKQQFTVGDSTISSTFTSNYIITDDRLS